MAELTPSERRLRLLGNLRRCMAGDAVYVRRLHADAVALRAHRTRATRPGARPPRRARSCRRLGSDYPRASPQEGRRDAMSALRPPTNSLGRVTDITLRFEPFTTPSATLELDELRRDLRSTVRRIGGRGVEERHGGISGSLPSCPRSSLPTFTRSSSVQIRWPSVSAHEALAGSQSARLAASPYNAEVVAAEALEDDVGTPVRRHENRHALAKSLASLPPISTLSSRSSACSPPGRRKPDEASSHARSAGMVGPAEHPRDARLPGSATRSKRTASRSMPNSTYRRRTRSEAGLRVAAVASFQESAKKSQPPVAVPRRHDRARARTSSTSSSTCGTASRETSPMPRSSRRWFGTARS